MLGSRTLKRWWFDPIMHILPNQLTLLMNYLTQYWIYWPISSLCSWTIWPNIEYIDQSAHSAHELFDPILNILTNQLTLLMNYLTQYWIYWPISSLCSWTIWPNIEYTDQWAHSAHELFDPILNILTNQLTLLMNYLTQYWIVAHPWCCG